MSDKIDVVKRIFVTKDRICCSGVGEARECPQCLTGVAAAATRSGRPPLRRSGHKKVREIVREVRLVSRNVMEARRGQDDAEDRRNRPETASEWRHGELPCMRPGGLGMELVEGKCCGGRGV